VTVARGQVWKWAALASIEITVGCQKEVMKRRMSKGKGSLHRGLVRNAHLIVGFAVIRTKHLTSTFHSRLAVESDMIVSSKVKLRAVRTSQDAAEKEKREKT
jgi:hypothetical protein